MKAAYSFPNAIESPSVLAFNPGHDGAIALVQNAQLQFSVEAEKNSYPRFKSAGPELVIEAIQRMDAIPDVVALSGWRQDKVRGDHSYFGTSGDSVSQKDATIFGKSIKLFNSTHERSHIFCSYGLSPFEQGRPFYALTWEGEIGRFYEIDENLNIKRLDQVLDAPGYKYSFLYQLADPHCKLAGWRHDVAGKLMALAGYSLRGPKTVEEDRVINTILKEVCPPSTDKRLFSGSPFLDCGVTEPHFMDLAGKFSDALFEIFHDYAKRYLTKRFPLLISGGCGLNCEWNSKWLDTGIFDDVFVPPVTNDSGSTIGTAIEAQFHFSGNAKITWNVYSGLDFEIDVGHPHYDEAPLDLDVLAGLLSEDKIIAWVQGRYEMGPRALGNRSLLASPFKDDIRARLNALKGREYYRPVAPVCLEEDGRELFGMERASPHMLYFHRTTSSELRAVTHVDGTARAQTVSSMQNSILYELLKAFKRRTGFGVLCNTSLNFPGRGFINRQSDLFSLMNSTGIDGAVVGHKMYFPKAITTSSR